MEDRGEEDNNDQKTRIKLMLFGLFQRQGLSEGLGLVGKEEVS